MSGSYVEPFTIIDVAHDGAVVEKYSHSDCVSSTRLIEKDVPSADDVTDHAAPPIGAALLFNAPSFIK